MEQKSKIEMSYTKSFEELQKISIELENKEIPIDKLADKLERARLLIEFCQNKLKGVEKEVEKILLKMNPEE